jgi:hypothetical protein
MTDSINKLLTELDDQLRFIELEQDEQIKTAQLCMDVCLKALNKLKAIIQKKDLRINYKKLSSSRRQSRNFFLR